MNADLFLPNSLRSQLRITDNARRLARDVYALSAVLASRRSVTMIGGNVNTSNDAIRPSRLWFAADPETIARRWSGSMEMHRSRKSCRPGRFPSRG